MTRALAWLLCVALVAVGGSAAAQGDELSRLFPREADVSVADGRGLARLRLPPEVLSETRGDLADVRLFDAAGVEVPFLLDSARRPLWLRQPRREAHEGELVHVRQRHRWLSGYWHHEIHHQDPQRPSPSGSWDLDFDVRRRASSRKSACSIRARPDRVLARGSIWRLRNPLREGLTIALPPDLPKRVRVVLRSEQHYLEPVMRLSATRAPARHAFDCPSTRSPSVALKTPPC